MKTDLNHYSYLTRLSSSRIRWRSWSTSAFDDATQLGKPILLFIGKMGCRWSEKFATETDGATIISELIQDNFVPIVLDRTERPDVAEVYSKYVRTVTGKVGSSYVVFLTPSLNPFYGGTALSLVDQAEGVGLMEVLRNISAGWQNDSATIVDTGHHVREKLVSLHLNVPIGRARPDFTDPAGLAFEGAYVYLFENYDAETGGFGDAPKYPFWSRLRFLVRCSIIQGLDSASARDALKMVEKTVNNISLGGLNDKVGGGVFRQARDDEWKLPSFEKLITDQAQLALTLVELPDFKVNVFHQQVVKMSLDYGLDKLRDVESGAFLSGEGASSTSSEVRILAAENYYAWTKQEIDELLGAGSNDFCEIFRVEDDGNIPDKWDSNSRFRGKNVLRINNLSGQEMLGNGEHQKWWIGSNARGLSLLNQRRETRPPIDHDTRIFSDYNGLMIGALARASGVLRAYDPEGAEKYLLAAEKAANFLEARMADEWFGSLSHFFDEGAGEDVGFGEDYAAVVFGLIELYDATLDRQWLRKAVSLQKAMDARFWDDKGGGYFRSAKSDPSIILQLRDCFDGDLPSANSMAALNLFRLGALLDNPSMKRRGLEVLQGFRELWEKSPWNHTHMITALEWEMVEPKRILLGGVEPSSDLLKFGIELGNRSRNPFVTLGLDAVGVSHGPGFEIGLPPQSQRWKESGLAHVYKGDTLLGVAQTEVELKHLLDRD